MLKDRFIDYLRYEKRFSPHTIQSYEHDLAQFSGYLQVQYQVSEILQADHAMIRSWIVSLLEQDITSRTINRKLSSLKSFYHYCLRSGVLAINPTLKVLSPKNSRHLPVFIDKNKLEQLFREVDFGEGFEGLRNRLIIMILYATGIRRAELIGIKMPDLDFPKSTLKVLGKRNKERIIPLGSYLCQEIDIYIKERVKFTDHKSDFSIISLSTPGKKEEIRNAERKSGLFNTDFLFVSSDGNKMNPRQVYSIVHRYLSMISSQAKLSPHVIRHTFATHMLNDGADLNAIKEILGHTSLAATQVYTHNTIEKLKLIYKQAHPRA